MSHARLSAGLSLVRVSSDVRNGWKADIRSSSFGLVIRAIAALSILAAGVGGCSKPAPRYSPEYQLSDDDIAAYAVQASTPSFRESQSAGGVIGLHNGRKVVAEFPLFDDGMSTAAIIHYDVAPDEACRRAGGSVRLELVPTAAAAVEQPFCVPKVLVDRNIRAQPL